MSNPIVTVKNHSSQNVYIEGDPNWDDQTLLLNNQPAHGIYTLAPDQSAQLSVDWSGAGREYVMGVIFADGPDYDSGGAGFYQMIIGQLKDSGLLVLTAVQRPSPRNLRPGFFQCAASLAPPNRLQCPYWHPPAPSLLRQAPGLRIFRPSERRV